MSDLVKALENAVDLNVKANKPTVKKKTAPKKAAFKKAAKPKKPDLKKKHAAPLAQIEELKSRFKSLLGDVTIILRPIMETHSAGGWGTDGKWPTGVSIKTDEQIINYLEKGKDSEMDVSCIVNTDNYLKKVQYQGGLSKFEENHISFNFEGIIKKGQNGWSLRKPTVEQIKNKYLSAVNAEKGAPKHGCDWHERKLTRLADFAENYYNYREQQHEAAGQALQQEKTAFFKALPKPKI